jgi:hypothetical protein
MLVRVIAPHFAAGIVYNETTDRCTEAAPILHWCVGLSGDELRAEVAKRGWRAAVVPMTKEIRAKSGSPPRRA